MKSSLIFKVTMTAILLVSSSSAFAANCKHTSGAGLFQSTAATSVAVASTVKAGSANR